jgi:hypothetical protein
MANSLEPLGPLQQLDAAAINAGHDMQPTDDDSEAVDLAAPLPKLRKADSANATFASPLSPNLASTNAVSPPSSPPRARSDPYDGQSPTKSALLSTPPRTAAGLERTARHPYGLDSASSSPTLASPLSNVSDKDLGRLVELTCGQGDNHYAARVGVRGLLSPDETSESGSFRSSGIASGSASQTRSIFSTGSFHPHATPNGIDLPLCSARHTMQFGRFSQANHRCDNSDCCADIPQGKFGWHCEICSFDICSNCFPFDWEPVPSQSTLQDSMSTLQLSSQSSSPPAAPRLQEGADAAAVGRGHHA